ncbi:MAG TPA: FAD-dependent oxidoreductase [Acidobacteriota bacterium]|nr:FAD-dependent oxidoreductase [Acidobacteriota bacterium]
MNQHELSARYFRRRAERSAQMRRAEDALFDAIVIGGGISGAAAFHELSRSGLRVALVEKGDFACATSQASAMMIWGGLLYLCFGDLMAVQSLSAGRDEMIRNLPGQVSAKRFVYLSRRNGGHPLWQAGLVLQLYWLMSGCSRMRPKRLKDPLHEFSFLRREQFRAPLCYEEAAVAPSDCRFVLLLIASGRRDESPAFNYCQLMGGEFEEPRGLWRLEVEDRISATRHTLRARRVVNAAGLWADPLNRKMGVASSWRHVAAKGVFLGLKRLPGHRNTLIIDSGDENTSFSLIPWGPVSLWGPTETVVSLPEDGFRVEPSDVRLLLDELHRHIGLRIGPADLVSIRCGVRPLPLKLGKPAPSRSIRLSRRYILEPDRRRGWITVYGGKFTGCRQMARRVARLLFRDLDASGERGAEAAPESPPLEYFPGLAEPIPSALWCAEREMCWFLEDYLRRRTNVSQWLPRGGLGMRGENVGHLNRIAGYFCPNPSRAERMVDEYRSGVESSFDRLLAGFEKGSSDEDVDVAEKPSGRSVLRRL